MRAGEVLNVRGSGKQVLNGTSANKRKGGSKFSLFCDVITEFLQCYVKSELTLAKNVRL